MFFGSIGGVHAEQVPEIQNSASTSPDVYTEQRRELHLITHLPKTWITPKSVFTER